MNTPYLRRTLGITAMLLSILISYRKMASGKSPNEITNGRIYTVTAAAQLSGKHQGSPILVKGLLRKNPKSNAPFLVDEDSVSTNPKLLSFKFSDRQAESLEELMDDTELVIEGWPQLNKHLIDLEHCRIISINKGSVYPELSEEQ